MSTEPDYIAEATAFRARCPAQAIAVRGSVWRVIDTGAVRSGKSLLLCPGTLGNADIFRNAIETLAPDIRVISVTYPMIGDFLRIADGAVALLDRLGAGRAHVLGSSLGGMLTQTIGARHPDRVGHLFVANSIATAEAIRAARFPSEEEVLATTGEALKSVVTRSLTQWPAPRPEMAAIKRFLADELANNFHRPRLQGPSAGPVAGHRNSGCGGGAGSADDPAVRRRSTGHGAGPAGCRGPLSRCPCPHLRLGRPLPLCHPAGRLYRGHPPPAGPLIHRPVCDPTCGRGSRRPNFRRAMFPDSGRPVQFALDDPVEAVEGAFEAAEAQLVVGAGSQAALDAFADREILRQGPHRDVVIPAPVLRSFGVGRVEVFAGTSVASRTRVRSGASGMP